MGWGRAGVGVILDRPLRKFSNGLIHHQTGGHGAAGNSAMEIIGYEPVEFRVTGMAALAAELGA